MLGLLRHASRRVYSTATTTKHELGHVRTEAARAVLLASVPQDQLELFAELKQGARAASLEKIESAILYTQLNKRLRELVFRQTQAAELRARDEPLHHDMALGARTRRVELAPRLFDGPPSKQDLRVLATTSRAPAEIEEAVAYVQECLKDRWLGKNFDVNLGPIFLKRAAAAGNFQTVLHQLTENLRPFKPLLQQDFYNAALRIYALRVPHLSARSKSMLNKLYSRSNLGLARELPYLYGLAQYKLKFGEQHQGNLPKTVQAVKELLPALVEKPRNGMLKLAHEDLVLGREGLLVCGVPGAEALARDVENVMGKVRRGRELSETLVVSTAELATGAEHGESEGAAETGPADAAAQPAPQ